jgi:peptide/nickel transport system substrate-binding protein
LKRFSIVICTLAGIAALAGIVSPVTGAATAPSASPRPIAGGNMVLTSLTIADCFDVQTCTLGYTVNGSMFATLVALDSKNQVIPYLADSWKIKPKAIVFHLRRGSTCADGTPITPVVVRNSFQRLIDVKAPNNAQNFGPGPYKVSADNKAFTFTFTSATPYSSMIYGFTNTYPGLMSGIICPAGLADNNGLRQSAVGSSGPYAFGERGPDSVTVNLRRDFRNGPSGMTGKTVGVPSTVVFKTFADQTTIANSLLTGGVDVGQVSGPDVPRLQADGSIRKRILPSSTVQTLVFNHTAGRPTASAQVREALITAVSRKDLLGAAVAGQGVLTTSIVTPSTPCYDAKTTQLAPTQNIAKARSVLQSAGYSLSGGFMVKDGQPLTINAVFPTAFGGGSEYLQQVWNQLGVKVNLSVVSQSVFSLALFNAGFDVSTITASINQPSAGAMTSRYSGPFYPTGTNFSRIVDQVLDRAKLQAQRYTGKGSCKYWGIYQEQLWKQWHLLPMYAPATYMFSRGIALDLLAPANSLQPYNLRRVASS